MMEPHVWKIEWNDGMSVGIPEVDEDHKQFVFLINEFNRSIVDHMGLYEMKKRLRVILDDAKQHFAHEENLFRQWKYPDADAHASKHAQAMKELQAIMERIIPYDLESEWIDAGLEVKDILINHLQTEDMKYADFYRKSHMGGATENIRDTRPMS